MELEQLLIQLASLTERAQQIWEAELRANEDIDDDDELDFEGEDQLWLALEQDVNSVWVCGYRRRDDEATLWAVQQIGRTPLAAVQALLAHIQKPHVPIGVILDQLADIHEERNPGGFS